MVRGVGGRIGANSGGPNDTVGLTEREQQLLAYLVRHVGRVIPQRELLVNVWEYSPNVQSRAVANTVTRLRKKLGPAGQYLTSRYGEGYRLDLPETHGLIGRQRLLEQAREQLHDHGCLTLYGVGGVGKTRLARALSASVDASIWVGVQAVRDTAGLVAAVAQGLGMPASDQTPASIRLALRELEPPLLVLDAAEGLPRDAEPVLESWAAAPVPLLLTSRTLLGDLPGLLVPPLEVDAAARLFERCATAVQPGESLAGDAVRAVVTSVDGLPLAVELAAARLRVLRLEELVERLDHDVRVLGGGERSLRVTLEGSWNGLAESEQRVLGAAALLTPATVADLEAVTGMAPEALLDALDGLVRAALVVEARPWFSLLEVVRAFVAERVDDPTVERFVGWAVARATTLFEGVYTNPRETSEGYRRDVPRLVRALGRASRPEDVARLVTSIRSYDHSVGRPARYDAELADVDVAGLPDALAVDVLNSRTLTPHSMQDVRAHRAAAKEAVRLAATLSDSSRLLDSVTRWVHFISQEDGTAQAEELANEWWPRFLSEDAPALVRGTALWSKARRAKNAGAYREALRLFREAEPWMVARPDRLLVLRREVSILQYELGNGEDALDGLRSVLADAEAQRGIRMVAEIRYALAHVESECGSLDVSRRLFDEVEHLGRDLGDPTLVRVVRIRRSWFEESDARAARQLAKLSAEARTDGQPWLAGLATREHGHRELSQGRVGRAAELYERSVAMCAPDVLRYERALSLAWLTFARSRAGEATAHGLAAPTDEVPGVFGTIIELVRGALGMALVEPPTSAYRTVRRAYRLLGG